MDHKNNRIILYSSQTLEVVETIKKQGIYHAKFGRIKEKYGEVSEVFLAAYSWYRDNASLLVPRSPEAESGIWAYADLKYLDRDQGSSILKLSVPINEAVFFIMQDWNKILNLRYIGETAEDERLFEEKLARYGVKYEGDIYLKPFYPQLKRELIKSWDNLFRFDELIKTGNHALISDIQAGLWKIEPDWVIDWNC